MEEMIENASAPVLFRIGRARILRDLLLHRTVGTPVEGASLMNRMKRVDDGGGNGQIETRRRAVGTETVQQGKLGLAGEPARNDRGRNAVYVGYVHGA